MPGAQRGQRLVHGARILEVVPRRAQALRPQLLAPDFVPVAQATQHVDDHCFLRVRRAPHLDRIAQAPLQVEQQRAAQRVAQDHHQRAQAQVVGDPAPGIDRGLDQHRAAGLLAIRVEVARHCKVHSLSDAGEVRTEPGRVLVAPPVEQRQFAQQRDGSAGADRREVATKVGARIEQDVGEFAAAEWQPKVRAGDAEFGEDAAQGLVDGAGRCRAQEAGAARTTWRAAGAAGMEKHLGYQGHRERLPGATKTSVRRPSLSARDSRSARGRNANCGDIVTEPGTLDRLNPLAPSPPFVPCPTIGVK